MSKDREFDKRKKIMMELLGDPVYQPMRFREIAGLLRLSKDEKKDLYRVLDDLVAEGKADLDSKGRYSKVTGRKRGKEKQRGKREERDEKFSGKRSGKYAEESSERRTGKKDAVPPAQHVGCTREHRRRRCDTDSLELRSVR